MIKASDYATRGVNEVPVATFGSLHATAQLPTVRLRVAQRFSSAFAACGSATPSVGIKDSEVFESSYTYRGVLCSSHLLPTAARS